MTGVTHRVATETDIPALAALMDRSITGPLAAFLTPAQIAASRRLMGIDSQLIADRTYVIVERDGVMAGCGGWSGRITKYGGDHTPGRVPVPLTPGVDAARIRAMCTAPEFVRQGIGRLILSLCEQAARRLRPRRPGRHPRRRASVPGRWLSGDRAVRGRSRRCAGASGQDGQTAG